MLDRQLVTDHIDVLRENLRKRGNKPEMIASLDLLLAVLTRRRELQTETDHLRAERNTLSKQIGPLMKAGQQAEAEPLKARVHEIAESLGIQDAERKELEEREVIALMSLPNVLDPRVPEGADESANVELRRWGTPRKLDFEPKDHIALGEALGILDFERAVKLSGARFPVYRGAGAALERGLINFFLDRATRLNGYTELMVPYIVSRTTMTGTGQLPKFEEDLFRLSAQVNGEDAFLIPTAEVPVTNLHRDEILDEAALPVDYCAFTPCFRSEAGSYGKDVRGLTRQHQFHKVELVQFTSPETSAAGLEELTGHAEAILQGLELPYRVMELCSGDTGFSAARTYDLEVWLPGQDRYREISSCSVFNDFQARRARIRCRPADGGKARLVHTLNGSGLAVGRTLVAVLENYQRADGSVTVPVALRPYQGGLERIDRNMSMTATKGPPTVG